MISNSRRGKTDKQDASSSTSKTLNIHRRGGSHNLIGGCRSDHRKKPNKGQEVTKGTLPSRVFPLKMTSWCEFPKNYKDGTDVRKLKCRTI